MLTVSTVGFHMLKMCFFSEPGIRMNGGVPLHPHMPSWLGQGNQIAFNFMLCFCVKLHNVGGRAAQDFCNDHSSDWCPVSMIVIVIMSSTLLYVVTSNYMFIASR